MTLEYYICTCGCITETDRTYCNHCKKELPHKYWELLGKRPLKVTFQDTIHRDSWLKLSSSLGMKVWKQ